MADAMYAVATPFVLLLLVGVLAISRLNSKIDRVPKDIAINLAFTPAERDLFCNDYARFALGLQVSGKPNVLVARARLTH